MPMVEYVVGFECDLSAVPDVAVQEAIEKFADHLRDDNEHDRPLQHVADLLAGWTDKVTVRAAMSPEEGEDYVAVLERGRVRTLDDAAELARLRAGGVRVINPRAALGAEQDPLLDGRPRQKLAAIDRTRDLARLLRALAHPSNARGAPGASEIRRRLFTKLTVVGGAAAEDALIEALAREDSDVIDPVIDCCVRLPGLLARLPAVLARAWLEQRELVVTRVLKLAADLEISPTWRATAPADLVAKIDRHVATTR